MPVLEERGRFWWNDETIPEGSYAPEESVNGLLIIGDDGRPRLELDGFLPSTSDPLSSYFSHISGTANGTAIQGILKGSGEYVLLLSIMPNGGRLTSNGISYENYVALYCAQQRGPFAANAEHVAFPAMSIQLNGFQEWLWMRPFEATGKEGSYEVRYTKSEDATYNLPDGTLSIEFNLRAPSSASWNELELAEVAHLRCSRDPGFSIEQAVREYQVLLDLLILLTDSDYTAEWPSLHYSDKKQVKLYFARNVTPAKPPKWNECLTHFGKLRTSFGSLVETWLEKREQFGPGFYLYLGTRRGVKLFIEHRFANLVWGLEAFDRQANDDSQTQPRLRAKIDRILNAIPGTKDRTWLANRLLHAAEPSLEQRLLRTFCRLSLPFDETALKRFCEECANRRNAISHFGSVKKEGLTYEAFLRELDQKSDALAALYHLLLLIEIGLDPSLLDFERNTNWQLSVMERALRTVGILSPKPQSPVPSIQAPATRSSDEEK